MDYDNKCDPLLGGTGALVAGVQSTSCADYLLNVSCLATTNCYWDLNLTTCR